MVWSSFVFDFFFSFSIGNQIKRKTTSYSSPNLLVTKPSGALAVAETRALVGGSQRFSSLLDHFLFFISYLLENDPKRRPLTGSASTKESLTKVSSQRLSAWGFGGERRAVVFFFSFLLFSSFLFFNVRK